MGYIVTPIAVDLADVWAALGSKNKALVGRIRRESAGLLDQIDEMLEDHLENDEGEDEDGNPPEPLTAADVLRHLIMGEPYREEFGFAYGYYFEALCLHFGEMLDNSEWSAMRSEWFDAVQKALKTAGVSEKQFAVSTLVFRGPPVELPDLEDSPCIGYLTKKEIPKARAALAKADLSKVKDRGAVESIEQIMSWRDTCAKSKRDLVCTYA